MNHNGHHSWATVASSATYITRFVAGVFTLATGGGRALPTRYKARSITKMAFKNVVVRKPIDSHCEKTFGFAN